MERGFGKRPVDFKNRPVRLGPFQTEQVERSTGSWLEAPVRNVLIDELVAGPELRQVTDLGFQVAAVVTGVVAPSMSVAHWDYRPIFAQGRLCVPRVRLLKPGWNDRAISHR